MEKRPNDTIKMLRAEFANVRKTAIVGHLHPDGDCISSVSCPVSLFKG